MASLTPTLDAKKVAFLASALAMTGLGMHSGYQEYKKRYHPSGPNIGNISWLPRGSGRYPGARYLNPFMGGVLTVGRGGAAGFMGTAFFWMAGDYAYGIMTSPNNPPPKND